MARRCSTIYAYRLQTVTGLRPGEIRGLTWDDVVIKRNVLTIRRSVNRYDEITQGKNENAVRCFSLNSISAGILRQQRALFLPGDEVFPITSTANYWARLKRYCESNGLDAVSPYELRHTFVSAVKNLPEGQIKAMVGHSRDMDTFGIYGHDFEGDQKNAGAAVEGVFRQILKSVL